MKDTTLILNPTVTTRNPVLLVDSIYRKVTKSNLSITTIPLNDPDITELSAILNTTLEVPVKLTTQFRSKLTTP